MRIYKRKTSTGETQNYYYDFSIQGKRYRDVCTGCTTKKAAEEYAKSRYETQLKLSQQKTVRAVVENYKQELTGGTAILLETAFERYMEKPRLRQPSEQHQRTNRSQWNDFVAFMKANYPDVINLDMVTKTHAESYINHIRTNGRFVRTVCSNLKKGSSGCYEAQTSLSSRSVNAYHKTIKSVFSKLLADAGLLYNPFDFELMANDSESREAFSINELKTISDHLDDFTRPLFIIGICTGLSKGDICTLRWKEIRENEWIVRKRRKTRVSLEIPLLPPVKAFLAEQYQKSGDEEYILPEHAKMYASNPSGISYRFKKFLESIGIQTTIKTDHHGRASSIRDIHSLRHTFAYLAGCYNIPLHVVQSILGHMSPEMTKHYQAHTDREAKQKYLAQMDELLMPTANTMIEMVHPRDGKIRALSDKLNTLTDEQLEQIEKLIFSFR